MLDKPRYSRLSDLLDMELWIKSKPMGVTIIEIQHRYSVSRRTAERMRDAFLNVFPQFDELTMIDHHKHWGFTKI